MYLGLEILHKNEWMAFNIAFNINDPSTCRFRHGQIDHVPMYHSLPKRFKTGDAEALLHPLPHQQSDPSAHHSACADSKSISGPATGRWRTKSTPSWICSRSRIAIQCRLVLQVIPVGALETEVPVKTVHAVAVIGSLFLLVACAERPPMSIGEPATASMPDLPTLAHNGGVIAFTSERDGEGDIYVMNGDGEIYVMDADGSNLQKLTDNRSQEEFPAWRPTPGLRAQ